jgi:hypothetical protein
LLACSRRAPSVAPIQRANSINFIAPAAMVRGACSDWNHRVPISQKPILFLKATFYNFKKVPQWRK